MGIIKIGNKRTTNVVCRLDMKNTSKSDKFTDVFFNCLFAQNYNKYNQGKYTDSFDN